jgi:hypothetical protein
MGPVLRAVYPSGHLHHLACISDLLCMYRPQNAERAVHTACVSMTEASWMARVIALTARSPYTTLVGLLKDSRVNSDSWVLAAQ